MEEYADWSKYLDPNDDDEGLPIEEEQKEEENEGTQISDDENEDEPYEQLNPKNSDIRRVLKYLSDLKKPKNFSKQYSKLNPEKTILKRRTDELENFYDCVNVKSNELYFIKYDPQNKKFKELANTLIQCIKHLEEYNPAIKVYMKYFNMNSIDLTTLCLQYLYDKHKDIDYGEYFTSSQVVRAILEVIALLHIGAKKYKSKTNMYIPN